MIASLAKWIDQRVGGAEYARKGAKKVFPEHWSFLLGEIALYTFVILLLTGTYLALFFDASWEEVVYEGSYAPMRGRMVTAAYASALEISFDVRAGLLVRQIHHWSALVFVAAIVVHMLRIFFTGAFRRPRELNWIIGVTLLVLAIIEGFAGYSLPDDLLSGVGVRIGYSITQSVPIVGAWAAFLLWGGEFPSSDFVSRLYIGHVFVLPLTMAGLLSAHLFLVVRQKHTQFPGGGKTNRNVVGERLWPTYAAKAVGLFFLTGAVMTLLGGLVQVNPLWLYGPYHAATVTTFAQPDWYMGWVEGAIRLLPPVAITAFGYEIPNIFFSGVLFPGVTFLVLYLYPFIEQKLTREDEIEHHLLQRPREHPYRTAFGVGTLVFYIVVFLTGSQDIMAEVTGASIGAILNSLRAAAVFLPPIAAVITFKICDDLRRADTFRERKLHLKRMGEMREHEEEYAG